MTKVDERAHVPKLDEAALRRLAEALARESVVAGYLIGSQARDTAGPLSDVDLAVWLDPDLPRERRYDERLGLMGAAARAVGTGEVDVVPLNDAPPLLRQRAIRDGRLLVDRDPRQRVRFETAALVEYLDTAPLRQALAAGLRRRFAEGTFGRR